MTLLERTFQIFPGIGEKTERRLWKESVATWDELAKDDRGQELAGFALTALEASEASWFAERLPGSESWRLIPDFWDDTVLLDIETTGLSTYYDDITFAGTFDGETARFFVKGHNLEDLGSHLDGFEVVVTYNGSLFDIPFLERELEDFSPPGVHIDLRYLLQGLGYNGGLKAVEQELGIDRPEGHQDFDGKEAVLAWRRFLDGDNESLKRLLRYNLQDTANLQTLLRIAYNEKLERLTANVDPASYQVRLNGAGEMLLSECEWDLDYPSVPEVQVEGIDDNLVEIHVDGSLELEIDRRRIPRVSVDIRELRDEVSGRGAEPSIVGIDLTGSEDRPSGVALLDGHEVTLDLLETDEQLVRFVEKVDPAIVSIDSPLGLPADRCCTDDECECRAHGIMRECEQELKRRGVNVYPCLLPSMQGLTARGIRLSKTLESEGFEVIESYPGAAQDILDIPRKGASVEALEESLNETGIDLQRHRGSISHDELDAITSAFVGMLYLADRYEALGPEEEGPLIVPEIERQTPMSDNTGVAESR